MTPPRRRARPPADLVDAGRRVLDLYEQGDLEPAYTADPGEIADAIEALREAVTAAEENS